MKYTYKDSSLIQEKELETAAASLTSYVSHIQDVVKQGGYDAAESSINLPTDAELLKQVLQIKERVQTKNLKYIIDVGIGGSNLGTKAIYDALYGFFDVLEPNRFPKIIFADTNNPMLLAKIEELMQHVDSADEIVVNTISKSGGTTETTANMEMIYAMLQKRFGEAGKKRMVITTDHGSKLWNKATELQLHILEMPKQVGGRYSVLSAVGLLPLSLAGIDIEKLRAGAAHAREQGTQTANNPALISAIILYLHSKKGHTINDNFFFNSELESIGKWYRQLMGESIGKEHDLQNKVVYAGITPTVSIGSTDLHSVGQLYLGGPRDKITTFISSATAAHDVQIPSNPLMPGLVDNIYGKKASEIMAAILSGVKAAYTKQGLPYMEVVLDDISEYSIGEFLQFKMIEMMYLGKLLNVNTFDQPHVELYKTETKKILST